MVCPNDRYSLKRHQDMFMESQFSQKDSADGDRASSSNQNTNKLIAVQKLESTAKSLMQGAMTSRRAKSNSDLGCVQVSTTSNAT